MFAIPAVMSAVGGMSAGTAVAAGASLAGGVAQGMAAKSAADYNAAATELQGQQARVRGDMDAANLARKQQQKTGALKSSLSGSGVEMNRGSAAKIQEDAAYMQKLDQSTLEYNTQMNVWGYEVEEINQKARGKNALMSGIVSGVSGAAGGIGSGYMRDNPVGTTPATGGTTYRR